MHGQFTMETEDYHREFIVATRTLEASGEDRIAACLWSAYNSIDRISSGCERLSRRVALRDAAEVLAEHYEEA